MKFGLMSMVFVLLLCGGCRFSDPLAKPPSSESAVQAYWLAAKKKTVLPGFTARMPIRPLYANVSGLLLQKMDFAQFLKVNALQELHFTVNHAGEIRTAAFRIEGIDPALIHPVRLFAEGQRKSLVGTVDDQGLAVLSGRLGLQPGKETRLYLKAEWSRAPDLDAKVRVSCCGIELTQESMMLPNAFIVPEDSSGAESLRMALALRQPGYDGSGFYRIPGLESLGNKRLVAVYDNRYNHNGDLAADIDVGYQVSEDGGFNWSPMRVCMDAGNESQKGMNGNGIGDPAVVYDAARDKVFVSALWSRFGWGNTGAGLDPAKSSQFAMVESDSALRVWSDLFTIDAACKDPSWHIFFNGPGKGIVTRSGVIVFPAQFQDGSVHESGKNAGKPRKMPYATIVFSKDGGKTWACGTGAKSNTTEAQVVELEDGALMLNMRDNRGGSRSVAVTSDFGKTWTEHPTSRKTLNEPVCQASLIRARFAENGKPGVLLFSNPNTTGGRHHMTIKASLDDGATFPVEYHLLLDDLGGSYSCMTMIDPETVGILYEGAAGTLVFMRVKLSEIIPEARLNPAQSES